VGSWARGSLGEPGGGVYIYIGVEQGAGAGRYTFAKQTLLNADTATADC